MNQRWEEERREWEEERREWEAARREREARWAAEQRDRDRQYEVQMAQFKAMLALIEKKTKD